MTLTLEAFAALPSPAPVTIHSLERSLYQITADLPGGPHLLVNAKGGAVRFRDLQRARSLLQGLPVSSVTLRHDSAYDEMIGQPPRAQTNALSLPLSREPEPGLPDP